MRIIFTLFLFPILFELMAQNAPPTVTITSVQLNEGAGTVTILFDLIDMEQTVQVNFRVSMDEGITFLPEPLDLSGDVGTEISVGTGRSITWNYGELPNIHSATVQVIAIDSTTPDIASMADQVDPDQLMQRLEQIAIPRHHISAPQGLQAVRDSLFTSFEDLGLQTSTHTASYSGAQADNILGRKPGYIDPARTYIVDGHYDAVPGSPGADDNGTAVAATLEIARILSQYQFKNSLRFIGFAFEEEGIVGAEQYVQNGIAAWEEINGVLNMEMIGYYSDEPNSQTMPAGFNLLFPVAQAELEANEFRGDFLTVVGNAASEQLNNSFVQAMDQYVPQLKRIPLSVPGNGQIAPDLRRSDHAPFWDAGIPALMLTDGSNYRNPNYHLPSDLPATIDIAFFTNCTKAVLAAAALLAEPINAGMDEYSLSELVGIHDHDRAFPCTALVHPNPAQEVINLQLGNCSGERIIAELFDLKGKKITGKEIHADGSDQSHSIPINGVPAGTYLLVLRSGESSETIKVEVN